MEQAKREALLRRSLEGDRARTALDELAGFLEDRKAQVLSGLVRAATPDEAFELAAEYRTIMGFEGAAKAAIARGDAADKKLMEE